MNKKIILPFLAISALAVSAFLSIPSNDSANALLIQNIEALTNEEHHFDYANGAPYTTKCSVAIGQSIFGTSKCSVTVITCQGGGSGCNEKKCPQHPA